MESHFPLGILVAWSWVDLDQTVLVYPRPLEGDLPLAVDGVADENDEGRRAAGKGTDDYQGLRSYQPGIPGADCTGRRSPADRGCWSRTSPRWPAMICGWTS